MIFFPPADKVDNKSIMCRYDGENTVSAFNAFSLEGGWLKKIDDCEDIPKEFDYVEE